MSTNIDHQPLPFGASCGICLPMGSEYCNDKHDVWFCTREPNHKGPHIACGQTEHHIKLWPNEGVVTAHEPPRPTEDEWAASMRYADEHAEETEPPVAASPLTGSNLSAFLKDMIVAQTQAMAEIYRRIP